MITPLSSESKTNPNPTQKGMNPSDKISSQTDTAFLSIDNVSKVYNTPRGPYTVLDGVNLEVAEGEFICIIGHSGCGKSTLLNMVSGFNQPTGGTVKLQNKPILNLPRPHDGIPKLLSFTLEKCLRECAISGEFRLS